MRRRPPESTHTDTLIPYTTRFRSVERICNIEGVRSAKKVSIPLRLMTPGFWSHCLAVADRLRWTYDGFFGLLASLEDFHERNGRMAISRSEERRVGKECVSQWRIRLSS